MNIVNMPGFTADNSLYKTSGHYVVAGAQNYLSGEQGITSQLRVGGLGGVSTTHRKIGPTFFQCGWNPKTLTSECTCAGDMDCNRMFTSGFCGENASCDTGNGTCRCDLKL
jgi:hypothetical protein